MSQSKERLSKKTKVKKDPDALLYLQSDQAFNKLYPDSIQALARYHWTPVEIAIRATKFLAVTDNVRILDIGCGVGKYCLAAGYYAPRAHIFGVEQRRHLLTHAKTAKEKLGISNVHFIHANFTQLDFKDFDHFYFFNSFYENLDEMERIDNNIDHSPELFNYYNGYLYRLLNQRPAGTRLVTFHSLEDEIPPGYHTVQNTPGDFLKFWIKAD